MLAPSNSSNSPPVQLTLREQTPLMILPMLNIFALSSFCKNGPPPLLTGWDGNLPPCTTSQSAKGFDKFMKTHQPASAESSHFVLQLFHQFFCHLESFKFSVDQMLFYWR